jgi:hypothetical protein
MAGQGFIPTNRQRKIGSVKGGKRVGAGRKHGTGKWGCKTVPVRVPEPVVAEVLALITKRMNERSGGEVRIASTVEAGRSPCGLPTPSASGGHRECPNGQQVTSGGDPAPTPFEEMTADARITRLVAVAKIGRSYVLAAIRGTRPRATAKEMYRRDLASLDQALGLAVPDSVNQEERL